MKKVNLKLFFIGLLLFLSDVFVIFEKLSHDNFRYYSAIRASLFDGYFGFFIVFVMMLLSVSIISYSLSLNNKLSRVGKYLVDMFSRIYKF